MSAVFYSFFLFLGCYKKQTSLSLKNTWSLLMAIKKKDVSSKKPNYTAFYSISTFLVIIKIDDRTFSIF